MYKIVESMFKTESTLMRLNALACGFRFLAHFYFLEVMYSMLTTFY